MSTQAQEKWAPPKSTNPVRHGVQASTFMPMPGDEHFDIDERFVNLQIFPGVYVKDHVWALPDKWYANPDLEVLANKVFKFDVLLGRDGKLSDTRHSQEMLAIKRVMYLILFRPDIRPFAPSTLRRQKRLLLLLVKWLHTTGKSAGISSLQEMSDYKYLWEFVQSLGKSDRGSLPHLYSALRWWHRRAPANYPFFVPPPPVEYVDGGGVFDPGKIRDDGDDNRQGRQFERLTDSYVAAAGKCWLDYSEQVLPSLLTVLRQLKSTNKNGKALNREARRLLGKAKWPNVSWGFRAPSGVRGLVSLASACQTSNIQLLSLVLGPRWSEIKPMKSDCIGTERIGGKTIDVLDSRTFKTSQSVKGRPVMWPVDKRVAGILKRQSELVHLLNGNEWPYLWTGFSPRLFGVPRPLRQIDQALKRFSKRHGFDELLNGTKIHHHRFRATVAWLVVVALHGGPFILRELFGHETLAMTMRYILANRDLQQELRDIAETDSVNRTASYVSESETLRGGGAIGFRDLLGNVAEAMTVLVPDGKRDQRSFTVNELIEFVANESDGVAVREVLPGVVGCYRPVGESGRCSRRDKPPDMALCDKGCRWNLLKLGPGLELARRSIAHALVNAKEFPHQQLVQRHWSRVITGWLKDFPELADEFNKDPYFVSLVT